ANRRDARLLPSVRRKLRRRGPRRRSAATEASPTARSTAARAHITAASPSGCADPEGSDSLLWHSGHGQELEHLDGCPRRLEVRVVFHQFLNLPARLALKNGEAVDDRAARYGGALQRLCGPERRAEVDDRLSGLL